MDFIKSYAMDKDANKEEFAIKNPVKDVDYYNQMVKYSGAESYAATASLAALL